MKKDRLISYMSEHFYSGQDKYHGNKIDHEIFQKNIGKEIPLSLAEWNDYDKNIYEEALSKAEHGRCVEISTQSAIREMVFPGLLAVLSPVLIGFVFGPETLGGLLAGVTVTGVLMAIPVAAIIGVITRFYFSYIFNDLKNGKKIK